MKKALSILLLTTLIVSQAMSISYWAEACKYQSEWEQCIEENKSWNPWGIDPETDFLCISSLDNEKIIYNIILDKHFKKIDEKADEYLTSLDENKDYYFWPNRKEVYFKWIDKNIKHFSLEGTFYNQYYRECDASNSEWILQETLSCLWSKTSIKASKDFFSNSLCIRLAERKLAVRKRVAQDTMLKNKQAVRKDEMKKYVQEQRSHYEMVVDLFMINLWYLLRIVQKWATKTKNPY